MTLELLQFIKDNNTLTRTSVPNHTSHRKDMKYEILMIDCESDNVSDTKLRHRDGITRINS